MIKLLHAADFHLDSSFSAHSPEQAALRRREQRLVLEDLAKLCQGCDLVLLAGDLFDSARIYRDTIDALKRFFAAVKVPVFISPGNHDCVTSGSPYLTEDWGENVHIFTKPTIERVHLSQLNCDVYGAGFLSPEQAPLLRGFRVADPSVTNLMVLHGDTQPNCPYNPICPSEIAASGLDYLALGHVHRCCVEKSGATTYAFPGCLMGRGFDECGQKGVLQVDVEKNHCKTTFLPLLTRKYEILTIDVGEDALAAIRSALPTDCRNDCYRLILTGQSDGIDLTALQEALSGSFFSLSLRDKTLPKKELWAAVGEDTLRGYLLRELKEQYDGADAPQQHKIAQAARLITALMDGREVLH